jgi:hypothetical protein
MKQLRQLLSLHSIVIEVSVAVEMIWIRKKLLVSPSVCLLFAYISSRLFLVLLRVKIVCTTL